MKITQQDRIYPLSPETAQRMAYEWSSNYLDYYFRLDAYQENIQEYYRQIAQDYLSEAC